METFNGVLAVAYKDGKIIGLTLYSLEPREEKALTVNEVIADFVTVANLSNLVSDLESFTDTIKKAQS